MEGLLSKGPTPSSFLGKVSAVNSSSSFHLDTWVGDIQCVILIPPDIEQLPHLTLLQDELGDQPALLGLQLTLLLHQYICFH